MKNRLRKITPIGFFTLIELMMVLGIIIVLISLVLPALAKGRGYARRVICASNMRQIALGFQMYKEDHSNYPLQANWLDDFRPIYPYLNNFQIFKCAASDSVLEESHTFLDGMTDYLACSSTNIQDIEKNGKWNNGHGNSPYKFDISNPGNKIQDLLLCKNKYHIIYDRYWTWHQGWINTFDLDQMSYEKIVGMLGFWCLDENRKIVRDNEVFPDSSEEED